MHTHDWHMHVPGTPTNHGERVLTEVQSLWDFRCSTRSWWLLEPSCIKLVCDINTLLLYFDWKYLVCKTKCLSVYGRSMGGQVEFDAYLLLRKYLSRNKNYTLSLVNTIEKILPQIDQFLKHPDWEKIPQTQLQAITQANKIQLQTTADTVEEVFTTKPVQLSSDHTYNANKDKIQQKPNHFHTYHKQKPICSREQYTRRSIPVPRNPTRETRPSTPRPINPHQPNGPAKLIRGP